MTWLVAVNPLLAAVDADQARDSRRAERAVEREEELYDDANEALDDQNWRAAADKFRKVVAMKMSHADDAMYWLAHSLNKLGERGEALALLTELQKTFPKSKWLQDAKVLDVQIRQSSGQRVEPEDTSDEDVKLMAINGLLSSNPERALPLLEQILVSKQSSKVKDKALFVLSQSSSPRALEVLGRIARDRSKPEMQSRALRYLGIKGDDDSRRVLGEVYASSNDREVKSTIMKSYMISGDSGRLLALAKTEPDEALRGDAVRQLGVMGARNELAALYATEKSTEVRKRIIKSMFIGGSADKLAEIARTEAVLELRLEAIKSLGLVGGEGAGRQLVSLYETNPGSSEIRKAALQGLFLKGDAKALIALARKEKDPAMKKAIVSKLSIMGSDEATDYMMELLKD